MTKAKEEWQKKGPASKLDDEAVLRLRELAAKGRLDTREAARVYGVATETIRRAVRGDTFTHLVRGRGKTESELAEESRASLERFQALLATERAKKQMGKQLLEELDKGAEHDAGYED